MFTASLGGANHTNVNDGNARFIIKVGCRCSHKELVIPGSRCLLDYLMLMEPTSHDNVLFVDEDSNDKAGLGEEIDVNFINVKLNA